jgi:hypothetical protein
LRKALLIEDKGYDGDGFRTEIVNHGAKPVIPDKSNRVTLHSFSERAYKERDVIERCFCRLMDSCRNSLRQTRQERFGCRPPRRRRRLLDQLSLNPSNTLADLLD